MLLDSAIYFVFLLLVVAVYWRLGRRAQNLLLLGASYFFYAWWDWRFLLLMAASTTIDFWAARQMHRSAGARLRRILLLGSLALNFCFLGYFKYFHFFLDSFTGIAGVFGFSLVPDALWKVVLPPAISFYTFQEVAYLVDVYHRKLEPAESLLEYALFISFFPHLIAGPIQRPGHLLPQVQRERFFRPKEVYDGCLLIVSGLFRKCVIADSAAQIANAAFEGKMGHGGWTTLLGAYAFALQIYGDFSGYSDIARGSAQLLGFHFMVNFRQPYLATSLQDFWRRWHISLSSWLRDYLYVPLGGNRSGTARTYLNVVLTMLIGGLWHGANWTFVVWGGLHGSMLAIERKFGPPQGRTLVTRWLLRCLIFHFVCFAWIFFRASTLRAACSMVTDLAHWPWSRPYASGFFYLGLLALPCLCTDLSIEHRTEEYLTQTSAFGWQLTAAAVAVFAIAFGSAYQASPFVYFQF